MLDSVLQTAQANGFSSVENLQHMLESILDSQYIDCPMAYHVPNFAIDETIEGLAKYDDVTDTVTFRHQYPALYTLAYTLTSRLVNVMHNPWDITGDDIKRYLSILMAQQCDWFTWISQITGIKHRELLPEFCFWLYSGSIPAYVTTTLVGRQYRELMHLIQDHGITVL